MAGTKKDLERTGLFSELTYISIGDKFSDRKQETFNESAQKGKQMSVPAKAGLFDETVKRPFEGEAYHDDFKQRKKEERKAKQKMRSGPFVPSGSTKKAAGPGNYLTTFGGKIEAMSPKERPPKKVTNEPRNFVTNPGKKGTGYGTPGVMIGADITYAPEKYDHRKTLEAKERATHMEKMKGKAFVTKTATQSGTFDKNPYLYEGKLPKLKPAPKAKKPTVPFVPSKPPASMAGSGAYMGAFNSYDHKGEKPRPKQPKKKLAGPAFRPSGRSHSLATKSVISTNACRSINASNFRSVKF